MTSLRVLASMQLLQTIFLVALLWTLHAQLRKPEFTRWWAWAWSASAAFLGIGVLALSIPRQWPIVRGTTVLVAVLFGCLQVPLLVFGAVSWRWPGAITRKWAVTGMAAALVTGPLSFGLSRLSQDAVTSFSIRHLPRTLALASALLFCTWVFFKRSRETQSRAAVITGVSCLAYALDQCFYAAAELLQIVGGPRTLLGGTLDISVVNSVNLISVDLVLMSGISLGMILLLVEGHQQAEWALLESVQHGRQVARENQALQAEIRKRHEAEQALRGSQETLAAVFRSSPCCMAITTLAEGRFLDVNEGFERLTGYSREAVVGRTAFELGLWVNPNARGDMLKELKAHGRVLGHEIQFRVKSGDVVTLLYSAELLPISGEPCVLSATQDLTPLKEVEARHRAILKAIPDWTFLQSRDGVYLDCQVRDQRNLLSPPEKFLGKNMRDVLPPDLAARLAASFDEALRLDQPVTMNYSLWIRDSLRFYEVRCVGTDNDQILSLVRDITDQKHAEYRARDLQDELAHAGRVMALGTLTGSLAHEINQPLTAIMANARAAERVLDMDQPDLVELRNALGDIVSDNRRIGEILRRLRLLLKKDRREHSPVDVNTMVSEVVELVHSDMVGRRVAVDVILAPNLPRVLGDRIQLQQVVLNLLLNAGGAVRPTDADDRRVSLTTSADNGHVLVSVADRGIGVSDEQLERMFEPFYTTKSDGMGLGLSICRTILDAHSGTIGARRNPDRGLTCSFSLAALSDAERHRDTGARTLVETGT